MIQLDLCFPGLGKGCPYYMGIITHLQELYGDDMIQKSQGKISLSCVSAGAYASAAFADGINAEYIIDQHTELMFAEAEHQKGKKEFETCYLHIYNGLNKLLSNHIHEKVNHRFFVNLSCISFPKLFKQHMISSWQNKNDFMIDIMRSSYLPHLTTDETITSLFKIYDQKSIWWDGIVPPSVNDVYEKVQYSNFPRLLFDIRKYHSKKEHYQAAWKTNIDTFKDLFITGYEDCPKFIHEYDSIFRKIF